MKVVPNTPIYLQKKASYFSKVFNYFPKFRSSSTLKRNPFWKLQKARFFMGRTRQLTQHDPLSPKSTHTPHGPSGSGYSSIPNPSVRLAAALPCSHPARCESCVGRSRPCHPSISHWLPTPALSKCAFLRRVGLSHAPPTVVAWWAIAARCSALQCHTRPAGFWQGPSWPAQPPRHPPALANPFAYARH
jgi:hypothetical protein